MSLAPLTLRYQTKAQFTERLRDDYRSAQGERATRLAALILGWIADGSLTDAECRAVFGQTVAQWAQFKTQTLTPQANARSAVRNARGQ